VGEYTAAAIVSFAYNKAYPVVDGNVYRVLSRLFAIDEPIDTGKGKVVFRKLAEELIDKKEPGLYNQAIMEFGALQCVPVSPNCGVCPANDFCMAYASQRVSDYPVKQGKQKIRHRYFNYLDIRNKEYTYLQKRQGQDIWKNLYEYPLIETSEKLDTGELTKEPKFGRLFSDAGEIFIKPVTETKHILSHQIIHASFYRIGIEKDINNDLLRVLVEDVEKYPVSRLMHKYIEKYL